MDRMNKRGNRVEKYFFPVDRSYFESKHKSSVGWTQYETDQDAWHFGIWVCAEKRQIITFNRGDITRIYCSTDKGFHAEIIALDEKYGIGESAPIGV